jgi:non-specific serine/threonine protein kinase
MKLDIVYNLYEFLPDCYLPNAFIVNRDQEGCYTHIVQKATMATVAAQKISVSAERNRLFVIMESLQPQQLASPYQKKGRKPILLDTLWEDRVVRKAIQKQLDRLLAEWLSIIVDKAYPISWDVERKVLVHEFLLKIIPEPLQARLSFRKTEAGVDYQLLLEEQGRRWRIAERRVFPIVNEPAWIMADYCLYRIDNVNGHLVKPFREKDEVHIPASSVNTYFKTFILKVVAKVEIDAAGFDVQQFDELTSCVLEPVKHLFEDRWVLTVRMKYRHFSFDWNDTRNQRVTLEVEEAGLRIFQLRRNRAAEDLWLLQLQQLGLRPADDSSHYELPAANDPLALLFWLTDNRASLEGAGFELIPALHAEREMCLSPATIHQRVVSNIDWFDLYVVVEIDGISFPFVLLMRNIRDGDRYFLLPNGKVFVIPEEWMSRYLDVATLGQMAGEAIRIAKSQYTLLSGLGYQHDGTMVASPEHSYPPPTRLQAQLRPYQLEGYNWLVRLYHQQLGACLADDMGLGKTVQTIAMLLYAKEQIAARPDLSGQVDHQLALFDAIADQDILHPLQALIIMPASLLYNWEAELKKYAPSLLVYRHTGNKRHTDRRVLMRFDVVLTTYQTALRDDDLLADITFEYIVLDESQQIKNRQSKVFQTLSQLQARHKISLSGTPIENSLADLWSQMQFINPLLLGSFSFFQKTFILPIERYQDEEKKKKLRQLVQPYLLRRTKGEVAPDLPPLSSQVFYSEMTPDQQKRYEREKSAARNSLLQHAQPESGQYKLLVVQTLTRLRQLSNHPRLLFADYAHDSGKFHDVLEQWRVITKSGHKVLFFSSFVQYLLLFRDAFDALQEPYAWLTGDMTPRQRQEAVDHFQQQADVRTFFISIKAGGEGLNLTAADYVFILDPWWNPSTEQQAIARAHRIGQDKSVFAMKFITKDSIEEKILLLQQKKSRLAADIIEKVQTLDFDQDELEFLLT